MTVPAAANDMDGHTIYSKPDNPIVATLDQPVGVALPCNTGLRKYAVTRLNYKRILGATVLLFVLIACVSGVLIYFFTRHPKDNEGARCPGEHCAQCNGSVCGLCQPGWFGADCSHPCTGCWGDTCNKYSGTCMDCTPGYYTTSCSILCPKNCKTSIDGRKYCDRSTGRCLNGCSSLYWGHTCTEKCSVRCENVSCLQTNGHCLHGCHTGWYGVMCGLRCPENCLSRCSLLQGYCESCDYGYRGPVCDITCHYCKDEDCTYNEVSKNITCTRGCKDGWTSTDCMGRCSKGCKRGKCDMAGGCSCVDGYYGDSCSQRCPDACKHNVCSKSGMCLVCSDGSYGDRCEKHCPKACPKCDKTSGHCNVVNSGTKVDSWMRERGLFPILIVGAFILDVRGMF